MIVLNHLDLGASPFLRIGTSRFLVESRLRERAGLPVVRCLVPNLKRGDLVRLYINKDVRQESTWYNRFIVSLLPLREQDMSPQGDPASLILIPRNPGKRTMDGKITDSDVTGCVRTWSWRAISADGSRWDWFTLALAYPNTEVKCLAWTRKLEEVKAEILAEDKFPATEMMENV